MIMRKSCLRDNLEEKGDIESKYEVSQGDFTSFF